MGKNKQAVTLLDYWGEMVGSLGVDFDRLPDGAGTYIVKRDDTHVFDSKLFFAHASTVSMEDFSSLTQQISLDLVFAVVLQSIDDCLGSKRDDTFLNHLIAVNTFLGRLAADVSFSDKKDQIHGAMRLIVGDGYTKAEGKMESVVPDARMNEVATASISAGTGRRGGACCIQ